jgi:hypothetical protein
VINIYRVQVLEHRIVPTTWRIFHQKKLTRRNKTQGASWKTTLYYLPAYNRNTSWSYMVPFNDSMWTRMKMERETSVNSKGADFLGDFYLPIVISLASIFPSDRSCDHVMYKLLWQTQLTVRWERRTKLGPLQRMVGEEKIGIWQGSWLGPLGKFKKLKFSCCFMSLNDMMLLELG